MKAKIKIVSPKLQIKQSDFNSRSVNVRVTNRNLNEKENKSTIASEKDEERKQLAKQSNDQSSLYGLIDTNNNNKNILKMKLLVTTDFSVNSAGAIRFAQTLAHQSKSIDVVFYHAVHFLKPTRWSSDFFNRYKKEEVQRLSIDLKKFVSDSIGKGKSKFASTKFVIDEVISTEKDIISYAEKNRINFICIATKGAGILRKIIGTHTSYLVNNSKTPIMVIPSHYHVKPLKSATYLSDFENLKKEIRKVSAISIALKINLEVLHYSSLVVDKKKFQNNKALFATAEYKNIKLTISENNLELSLVEKISKYVDRSKPELLIMFTNREKGFFESIFLPSKSSELTYTTRVPVFVFSK